MSEEPTEGAGLDLEMVGLTDAEMARLLVDQGLSPKGGSPLANLAMDPGDMGPELSEAVPSGIRRAAGRVARPERVVAMVLGAPPDPPEHLWFYGEKGDLDYAFYSAEGTGRHHLAWPVDGVTMLDLATAPLALNGGTEPTALSMAVGPEEFSTLCVISDFLRQETLRRLMTPVPPPESLPSFHPEDLATAAARAGAFSDLGWMVPRAEILSPVPLDFGEETLAAGVASLRESGLLIPEGDRNEMSILLHRLCHQLGLCDGFSAVSNWRQDPETQGWGLEHFALSRGPGTLLLLEFQEVTESGFLVALDDVTPELAFHWLQGALPIPEVGPWAELEELPEVKDGDSAGPTGGDMAAGIHSGRRPATTGPGGPTGAHPPTFCNVCGKPLDPGKRFCTACGSPAKGTEAHD